jgi:xanthine dehydrogenase YagS FAD-binding subunit
MNPFNYQRATSPEDAIHAVSTRGAKFLGGGTNLVDLMKYSVEQPTTLIDVTHISFNQIASTGNTTTIGAGVRNSDLANHETIRTNYPLLSQALLSGASPQLRNMATTGGNLLQRTRCGYFMDTAFPACNKRTPGSGCSAIKGFNRNHAILGTSSASDEKVACIATNPSDMNVALAALNATIHVTGPKGKRTIAIADFHRLPGTTPQLDTNLKPDELITAVELPAPKFAKHSYYLKVRDRHSYAFALVSVAAGLEMSGNTIQSASLALGGVAHKPWRSLEAEKFLVGTIASPDAFKKAADLALAGAKPYQQNAFKVELAKQSIVRALTLAAQGVQA